MLFVILFVMLKVRNFGPEEPVVNPISTSGEIVRINLRPYVHAGGNQQDLLDAFIRTANEYKGFLEEFILCWAYAENMVREGNLKLFEDELTDFVAQMKAKAFPAVHHSELYKESYNPAYRVIALSILNGWREVKD